MVMPRLSVISRYFDSTMSAYRVVREVPLQAVARLAGAAAADTVRQHDKRFKTIRAVARGIEGLGGANNSSASDGINHALPLELVPCRRITG
jgi:hypothetical protein